MNNNTNLLLYAPYKNPHPILSIGHLEVMKAQNDQLFQLQNIFDDEIIMGHSMADNSCSLKYWVMIER